MWPDGVSYVSGSRGLGRQTLRLKILLVALLPLECEMKEISFVIDRSGFEYTSVLCQISFMSFNSDEVYI